MNKIKDNTLYRFRSIDKLCGSFQELENQTIYFSPPENLNDPVEGLRDIYFKGDSVLWKNLFRDYLLCLVDFALYYISIGESEKPTDVFVKLLNERDFHGNMQPVWSEISNSFFDDKNVSSLIENIIKYRVSVTQVELTCYLTLVHHTALDLIFKSFKSAGIINVDVMEEVTSNLADKMGKDFFEALNESHEKLDSRLVDEVFIRHQSFFKQCYLALEHNRGMHGRNAKLLHNEFPFEYINRIEQLMYPKWFTACFMSCATNSSVWGNYGNNHTGVCLIFNADFNESMGHHLKFNNVIVGHGMNGPILGSAAFKFYEIRYTNKLNSLNFFESLGCLPIPLFNSQWLVDRDGNKSGYAVSFDEEWRQKYWDDFYLSITQKSEDWRYENEHRLLINNMSGSYASDGITLNYDFKSLKGIIFGIKTSDEDKLKIINIVKSKVIENEHYDFKLYQAHYCRHTGEIKHTELSLFHFKK